MDMLSPATEVNSISVQRSARGADVLSIGFGTAASMWAVGYFCRLFGPTVPAALLFGLLLAVQLIGGFVAGRYVERGLRLGLLSGLIAGGTNLLVVGSLISGDTPNAIKFGAVVWIPGTLVVSAGLGLAGAALGRTTRSDQTGRPDWDGLFPGIAAGTTFLLLAAGGLVTGFDEGLAVVDWPNTEGYNMFLYPLSRMTGGVYLEHAHRLLGSLVGLCAVVLALHIQLTEPRSRVAITAWVALACVIIQGILGGLRVTGVFTLSTDPNDTDPSVILAIIHGIFGQAVFGLLVALAVVRSRAWRSAAEPILAPQASTDRALGIMLIVLLIIQLALGALVRHFTWALSLEEIRYGLNVEPGELIGRGEWALTLHITVAVIVALGGVGLGSRSWGLYGRLVVFRRLGVGLLMLIAVQMALGVAALIVTGDDDPQRRPGPLDVTLTTAHQVAGAALLACAVMILLWNHRRLLVGASRGYVTPA